MSERSESPPPPDWSPPASEADARDVRQSLDSFVPPPAREALRYSQDSYAPPPPPPVSQSVDSYAAARTSVDSYAAARQSAAACVRLISCASSSAKSASSSQIDGGPRSAKGRRLPGIVGWR